VIILDILEASGTNIRYSHSDKNEVTICCPFCQDTRFRLGINLRNGKGHCFNDCGFKSRDIMYTARMLCEAFGIKFSARQFVQEQQERRQHRLAIKEPEALGPGLPLEYETFNDICDNIGRKARAYLKNRGVSALQIAYHKIGFAAAGEMAWRILFPIVDEDGIVHGCAGRDFSGQQTPKYLNTPGVKLLWNAHRPATAAVVVEGVMDAIRVERVLLQTKGTVAVARLGSIITTLQMNQLKHYDRVTVFPDCDRAGVHGAIELCRRCDARGISVSVVIPRSMTGRDPGDMEEDEILESLGSAVCWSVPTEQRLRLAATREESL
jgi:DNA primase